MSDTTAAHNLLLYTSKRSKTPLYVSSSQSQSEIDGEDLLKKINSFLDPNAETNKEFSSKLEILKRRYQHAVKSELVNFCYASSLGSHDPYEPFPEIPKQRGNDFVTILLNVVEKDQEMNKIAAELIADIETIEQAKSARKCDLASGDSINTLISQTQKARRRLLENLEAERQEIFSQPHSEHSAETSNIQGHSLEQNSIYPSACVSSFDYEVSADCKLEASNADAIAMNDRTKELQVIRAEFARGFSKIMSRLDSDFTDTLQDPQSMLAVMKAKINQLQAQVKDLQSEQTVKKGGEQ